MSITGKQDDREWLIDKIFELGFEVGYKNHSEVGWVLREYNALVKEALNLGIKSPETYYYEGKIKGKASRDRGVVGHKNLEKGAQGRVVVSDKDEAPYDIPDDSGPDYFFKKPNLVGIPQLIKKIRMVKIPKFLDGFKLFGRK